jgi:hypothetical protein
MSKTIISISNSLEVSEIPTTGHFAFRPFDQPVSGAGSAREAVPDQASVKIKEPHVVKKVTVDRDASGNLYITLEE